MSPPGARRLAVATGLALLAIVVLGVGLRAQAIAETRVIGAEDPFTHVVFTRESLQEGAFDDSRHLGTSMYPPGMHALFGVLASLSGMDMLLLARWLPLAFAALAIVGAYALGRRLGSPAAGLGAAFLMATIPEIVFRTQLLFPTALDLALLPAWLLAFHEASRPSGERAGYAPALFFLALTVPLAWMHPWVVPLFAAPALAYVALRVVRAGGGARVAFRRMRLPVALTALATAFAMASRWDAADTGFADFLSKIGPLAPLAQAQLPPAILFVLLVPLLALAGAAGAAAVAGLASLRLPRPARIAVAVALAITLALLAWIWPMTHELPHEVSYRHNLGRVAILFGTIGLFVALLRPTPLSDLGLSISVLLAPLTAIDLFGSQFWPQRTVAYLAIGVALLGAAAVGAACTWGLSRVRLPRARRVALPFATIAAVLLLAGPSLAMPSKTYDWYRLYDDDDYAALEEAAALLSPGSRVFVQSWQPALVVKALAEPDRVWYSPKFFLDEAKREQQLDQVSGRAFVVVDRFALREETQGKADLSFLDDEPVVVRSDDGGLRVYQLK